MRGNSRSASLFAAFSLLLSSCATSDHRAPNTSRAQFLDEVWVAPELEGKALVDRYTKVYFAPVNVGQLKKQGWWASQNIRTAVHLEADALMLANYMHAALEKAAKNYPAQRLEVVGLPGPDTVVVESAITELVPTKAFWDAAATAAGFAVQGVGMLSTFGKGVIGIEGRLRDGETGAVIATFRERDTDQFAVLNLAAYTWYHGSEANIDDLAKKAALLLNTPTGTVVKNSSPFRLVAF